MQIIFPNFQVVRIVNLKVQMRVIMRVTFQYRALAADRQMLPQLQGFLKMIVNHEYHPSQAIRAGNLQLKMKQM